MYEADPQIPSYEFTISKDGIVYFYMPQGSVELNKFINLELNDTVVGQLQLKTSAPGQLNIIVKTMLMHYVTIGAIRRFPLGVWSLDLNQFDIKVKFKLGEKQ